MRHLLLKPVIFVSIILGLFIIGELIALGGLTWRNHQRLSLLEQDVKNGHHLEETIFVLLSSQLQEADKSQTTLLSRLPDLQFNDSRVITDVSQLRESFAKALEGDKQSWLQSLNITRHLISRQIQEEENLLSKIAEDTQLEFKLAIILPLLTFFIIFIFGRHFFNNNVIAPLDSLKDFLQMLARGDRQPIRQQTADPVMRALFDNYNQLVLRLIELEKEHVDYTTELEHKIRQTTSTLLEQSQQIARSERLSVVAELAASTAHELRNPLAGIQLALENILQECPETEWWDRLNAVNNEIKRLTRHLNDLLALTRPSANSSEHIDVNQICNELKHFLNYQIPENIRLIYQIEPKLNVYLPATEFRLALLNLLLNAIQAIGHNSGRIQLIARHEHEQIVITVQDSGPGFNQDFLEHGIRPFVSLKEKGTGLGLATVKRFVKSQQGKIRLYNNDQGHACVTLTLPVSES